MNNDKYMIKIKMDYEREALMTKMRTLKNSLEIELRMLESDENYIPNKLGVIQGIGMDIDVLCARIGAFSEIGD